MSEQEKYKIVENGQEIAKNNFKEKRETFKLLMDYQDKFNRMFLDIKLAFLAFLGVIFVIVFNNYEKFSDIILIFLLAIIFLTFLLILFELRRNLVDLNKAIKDQYKGVMLTKICDLSVKENQFSDYGIRAQELLIQDEDVRQRMYNKESITDIIKFKEKKSWKITFWVWAVLFLIVPVIFLIEIFRILK